jgi:hypothetical protein
MNIWCARSASAAIHFNIPDVQQISLGDSNINLNLIYSGNYQTLYEPRTINSTYSIVSTGTPKTLFAQINQNMPANSTLEIKAEAPDNATSMGFVTLSTIPTAVITNISDVSRQNLLLYYRLKAQLGTPVSVNESRIVTFTIMD